MFIHPKINCLMLSAEITDPLRDLRTYLESLSHLGLTVLPELPADVQPFDVIVTARTFLSAGNRQHLADFARAGGGWLVLVDGLEVDLPDDFGVQPSPIGPEVEMRVLFQDASDPTAARLPDAIYISGRHQYLKKTSADTSVILYADWRYEHIPVLTRRRSGAGQIACTTLQEYDHPVLRQIIYRVIRQMAGKIDTGGTINAGLLGYPPWLGRYHATGVQKTAGLNLAAVCEINANRLQAAGDAFPHIATHTTAENLAADPGVDLVLVATPPDTHCRLSLQMMAAGKHVVCEKPLALTCEQTGLMSARAEQQKVHLSCHQNRRWDVDYLAIRQAVRDGAIGDLFYAETFVGGFDHPCGYWHSHEAVSGGLSYDWGGHYLDWLVSLIPARPVSVIATRHKLVWHDVTNADQERIQIRFAGNQEADFIHSDIAAALKPKWYLLGTKGAIVGSWQRVTALSTDPVTYYREEPVPITEKAPELILHHRHRGGSISREKLVLPQRQHFGFHRNLADHLLTGEPLAAPLKDSMTVIAILEAAARSAARGGSLENIDG